MLPLGVINEKMSRLNNWALEENFIVKDFGFANFKGALEFVKKVSEACEKHEHYPDVLISMGKVRLSLTTHYEKGLTSKDFEVAEDIDKISSEK